MGRIRLAERRGIFTRRRLSEVQSLAIQLLMVIEQFQAALPRREAEHQRIVRAVEQSVIEEEVTEANFDDGAQVVWKMPEMTPADAADVLALMGKGGMIDMSDLDEEDHGVDG